MARIDGHEFQHPDLNVNETNPVQIIHKSHADIEDRYFDMHYELEIGLLLKGRMARQYFDHQMTLGPGDVWLCGMWEPHGYELVKTPCEAVIFVVDPRYLADSRLLDRNVLLPFQSPPALRPKISEDNRLQSLELAQRIKMTAQKDTPSDWAKLYFFQLLLLLLENWKVPKMADHFHLQESIQNALELVFKEKRRISTGEAARVCHMSDSKFRATFKALMQSSFSDFALKYRVRGAIATLRGSRETQETIAQQWGFTDASHLHKCIKKTNGN